MTPTREQCLKWAEDSGLADKLDTDCWADEYVALCLQVWKEAQEEVRDEMNRERIW